MQIKDEGWDGEFVDINPLQTKEAIKQEYHKSDVTNWGNSGVLFALVPNPLV